MASQLLPTSDYEPDPELRIEPSRGPGTMAIDWIRLEQGGEIIEAWEFE